MLDVGTLLLFVPALFAGVLGALFIPRILLVAYRKRLFDPISERKLHRCVIPRLGGISFVPIQVCLFALTVVLVFKLGFGTWDVQSWALIPHFALLFCGLLVLYMVGLGDDLIGIGFKWKFFFQVLVACFFPLSGLWINDFYGLLAVHAIPEWIGMPLTVFLVVLIINAINLMDGLDGLCAGIVGIGCLVFGLLFYISGAYIHTLFALITVGSVAPFFYYNVFGIGRKKRRIFMGDIGSTTLGYSLAFLAVSYATNNSFIKPFYDNSIIVAYSVLLLPVLDVARVMFIRWKNGKPLYSADQNHLHHLLLRIGIPHRGAMLFIVGSNLFYVLFNLLAIRLMDNNLVVVLNLLMWGSFYFVFAKIDKSRTLGCDKIRTLNADVKETI
ncbi:MraY family glycosyltransferase [Sphingobacterium faecale]|uniref:Undecaprenyl/decaprenyl-phosphate alpha-N-acetylglucosaminyl 1-phosphate transferase n=1 Tax=Sphingobacterium faecale TaxID=2803775 RepID=A0ABS1QY85_9SPHI|nr:MraY family glycosyltransferase [Sphingobacterium faecale]MBL1407264.1 undecaprenyl/decaprenyl-phosphate alpha-N-acetylglucosaminyl 1-phosphate transferase [Sphingobacterium faecale]